MLFSVAGVPIPFLTTLNTQHTKGQNDPLHSYRIEAGYEIEFAIAPGGGNRPKGLQVPAKSDFRALQATRGQG
jgi:hypothetical protein